MLYLLAFPFFASAFATEMSTVPERLPISRGDNLSSISKTVFGDSNYWPKIWSKDSAMVNPGNSIQFLLGDEEAAPSFAISESDEAVLETKAPLRAPLRSPIRPVAAAATKANGDFEIPPPKIRPKPLLDLGGMFPKWQARRRSSFKDYGVEIIPRRQIPPNDREFVPVYVQDSSVRAVGEYVHTSTDSGLMFEGEEVMLRMKSGAGQVGAHYLLLRDGGRLQDGWATSGGSHDGHVVEVIAEVVITEDEQGDGEHFRAKVVHVVSTGSSGTDVVPGQVTWINTSPNGSVANVQAEVIGGNFDARGMIFGQGDWVFLNRGAKDGLAEGQLLWINTLPRNFHEDSSFAVGTRNASLVKIAKVASEISTAIVLSSKQGIMQHDFSGEKTASLRSDRIEDGGGDISNDLDDPEASDIGIDNGTGDGLEGSDLKDTDSSDFDNL